MASTGLLGMIAVTVLFWDMVGGGFPLGQTQADLGQAVTPATRHLLLPDLLNG